MLNGFCLTTATKIELQKIYEWKIEEEYPEHFTCRPVNKIYDFETFSENLLDLVKKHKIIHKILSKENKIVGEIKAFDYNMRNKSIEFGYYLPKKYRGLGYGTIMIELFLKELFEDDDLALNKIYATTCEVNYPSIKVLEKTGFTLDGKNREHYWIGDKKYTQNVYSLLRSEWILHNL
ncbi:MAG: GNAT family N-acetyltransferase [Candidatus Delongbacteria bacterium]|nr:GNAT family N-acetyltransferase [Candidatus Delongbacteria bacterium]MBN2833511.1 GNAT family N-acetyltransferase [Candidatus Delongbacteria bacterium]